MCIAVSSDPPDGTWLAQMETGSALVDSEYTTTTVPPRVIPMPPMKSSTPSPAPICCGVPAVGEPDVAVVAFHRTTESLLVIPSYEIGNVLTHHRWLLCQTASGGRSSTAAPMLPVPIVSPGVWRGSGGGRNGAKPLDSVPSVTWCVAQLPTP